MNDEIKKRSTLSSLVEADQKNAQWQQDLLQSLDYSFVFGNIQNSLDQFVSICQSNLFRSLELTVKSVAESLSYANYFQDFLEEFHVTTEEAVDILSKYKWIISPSFPLEFFYEVIEIGRQPGNQTGAINHLYKSYFSENEYQSLVEMVDEWKSNSLFEPRHKIIRDCVSCLKYSHNKYNPSNLVIPTLIAQIDGVISDYMEETLEISRNRRWKEEFQNHVGNDKVDDLSKMLLLDILFQKALRGQSLKTPFTFSRHKIMHGEYTQYRRIDNTLRAFLILDFLFYVSEAT